jgi:hypothetical protein
VFSRIRRTVTYANVTSSVALFLVLSTGVAYAADEWTGANIKNGTLTYIDLAVNTIGSGRILDNSLTATDLGANSVGTSELVDNAVKGADVDESTLGQVPSSYHAAYSDFADGVAANSVGAFELAPNPPWRYIGDPGEPGFLNGWSNYDAATNHVQAGYQHAGFYRDNLGVVHLGGLVKGGTGAIFHLPQGYCPWFYHAYPAIANNGFARITVTYMQPGCDVILEVGSNVWVSLDGISWRDGYEEDTPTGVRAEMARRKALGSPPPLP